MPSIKEFFVELLEYSHHCNQAIGTILCDVHHNIPEKSVLLFHHILNAQSIWNSRIQPGLTSFEVWQKHDQQKCLQIDRDNLRDSTRIIDELDMDMMIEYTNTRGNTFRNSVYQIVFHIINHSTYHRAQIAAQLKQVGIEPPISDFIIHKRR
jgi:uncharacterized damage-inducible protein DinB